MNRIRKVLLCCTGTGTGTARAACYVGSLSHPRVIQEHSVEQSLSSNGTCFQSGASGIPWASLDSLFRTGTSKPAAFGD